MSQLWILVYSSQGTITNFSSNFEPRDQILNHFSEWQAFAINPSTIIFANECRLEPILLVTVDGRLPEKLDETGKVEGIVVVGL